MVDFESALATMTEGCCDVALVDGNEEWISRAVEFCGRVRAQGVATALIIISFDADLGWLLRALDAGADDFLIGRRLNAHEVCHRVRIGFLRASRRLAVQGRELSIDRRTETILVSGRVLSVTKQQRLLLMRLAIRIGHFVSASELGEAAGIQRDPEFKNLRNQIWRLRKRMGAAGQLVEGAPGAGYRLTSWRLPK
jgi:DNA-binding response OmpR family regulator